MKLHGDMGIPDIQALVRFGALGVRLFGARILSFGALVGFFALAFFAAYPPVSWIGAAICGIAAVVFIVAVNAETGRSTPGGTDGEAP